MISGRAVSKEIDPRTGAIKVNLEFTLTDGTKVTGKSIKMNYNTQFSREKIEVAIKEHCETLMKKAYNIKKNTEIVESTDPLTKVNDIKIDITECDLVVTPAVTDKDGNVITPAEVIKINDTM